MVDRDLLNWLEEIGLIDQRFVLWWQKGFEDRRIYSEEEFNDVLEEVSYEVKYSMGADGPARFLIKSEEKTFNVWPQDDVPILLRDYFLKGRKVPVFISIKPMSHDRNEGWRDLEYNKSEGFPLSAFHQPHIRGIVIEDNEDFLFWFPVGSSPMHYHTRGVHNLFDNQDLFCIIDPIHPSKFYHNLIKWEWTKGKRPQREALEFDCSKEGYKIVPYYDFNKENNHLMIYPAHILRKNLDLPVIIKGNKDTGRPGILGIGSFYFREEAASYWELDGGKQKIARNSLIERLGRI